MPKQRKVKVSDEKIPDTITAILDSYFWLPTINTMENYGCLNDDHDGKMQGRLNIMFTPDGDARVWITGEEDRPSPTLRFRMPIMGGGLSPKTRVALLILAEAIRQDNKENKYPQ